MKKKFIEFRLKNKTFKVETAICDTILKKAIGLMFRKKSKSLLFLFHRPTREPIHSYFCGLFIAIWFDSSDKVIDARLVYPWKSYVRPSKKFVKLLEIPSNDPQFEKIRISL